MKKFVILPKKPTILCLFSIILEPSEALHAHFSYCKHHKTLLDYLSNYQGLFRFDIGNVICDDPTASIPHSGLLSCCHGSLTPNWIMLSPILMAKTYSSGLCSWRENNWIKRWSLIKPNYFKKQCFSSWFLLI